jgi:hypothetical protein
MDRTSKRTRCSAGRILMLVLALTEPLFAQGQSTSAIWRGVVKDSVGTPIVGAKVRLKGTFTSESATAADGSFSLVALPAAQYKLTWTAWCRSGVRDRWSGHQRSGDGGSTFTNFNVTRFRICNQVRAGGQRPWGSTNQGLLFTLWMAPKARSDCHRDL